MIAAGFSMATALLAFATPTVAREVAVRDLAQTLCPVTMVCRRVGQASETMPFGVQATPIGTRLDRIWIPLPCKRTGSRMIC